jgi:plasmid stabilization system protein ParE
MNRARFIAGAREELLAQIRYYNEAQPGLGRRFSVAVEEASALALTFPEVGSPSPSHTRRVMVKGFPFSVVYRPEPGGILIFAVAHHAQRPNYWRSRTRTR